MSNVQQGFYGWEATTQIDLQDGYALRIKTMKRNGGMLATTASRVKLEEGGGFSSFPMDDFSQVIISQKVRVTSGAVKLQHDTALEQVSEIKARMVAFYASKEKELATA
jgi:hypothetical protein